MVTYPLRNGLIEAATPVEVGHNTGHFWFPSLHKLGDKTLICAVIRSADVAQGKWPGELFVSEDAGTSWRQDQSIETYGHTSVSHDQSTTLMMPYELWPLAPQDRASGVAHGTLLSRPADGPLEAEAREVRFCDFPAPLEEYNGDELTLHHNGNILHLSEGTLYTTLYGTFGGEPRAHSRYCCFAAVSEDGGFTWSYRSTVADGDAAPGAPEGPNESATLLLDNGDLMCVYRVSGGWDFHKSYSADAGHTWSESTRVKGTWSVEPRLARLGNGALVLTGGRPGLFLWFCNDGRGEEWEAVNLGKHHNQLVEPQEERFSDAFSAAERGEEPAMSTSYTGIMPLGSDEVMVAYDRLANGWSGAPGPNGVLDRVFSVVLKVSV